LRIDSKSLAERLKQDFAQSWLVFGTELLLVEEAADAVRKRAEAEGVDERLRFIVETGFDWAELGTVSNTGSLFASRRLIELRIPNSKPGKAGEQWISDWFANPSPNDSLLIIAGKIERNTLQKSGWISAIDQAGIVVEAKEVAPRDLPDWLVIRASRHGMFLAQEVAERLAWYVEGNLLAAAQIVDQLALFVGEAEPSREDVDELLTDNARFEAAAWVDALLVGRLDRGLRILSILEREGVAPASIVWRLAQEIRAVAGVSTDLAAGVRASTALRQRNVWRSRTRIVEHAAQRLRGDKWQRLLSEVSVADRQLKGRAEIVCGSTIWHVLERITLLACGVELPDYENT